MGHKTLMNGTGYRIVGGKTRIGGTAYDVVRGRTLAGGTAYDIPLGGAPCTVTISGTLPNSAYADWSLRYGGTTYRSGSFPAAVGGTVSIVQAVTSNPSAETSIKVNGTWVVGEGGWFGVTGPVSYELTLTGDAAVSVTAGGSGTTVYADIAITMT